MSVKLIKGNTKNISMQDLSDGQIGEVIDSSSYTGTIVQCVEGYGYISIGEKSGKGWSCRSREAAPTLRIRILEEGESLIITDN